MPQPVPRWRKVVIWTLLPFAMGTWWALTDRWFDAEAAEPFRPAPTAPTAPR